MTPTAMPIRPPSSERTSASTRNWARMSRPRAPMALRMPISRVRSRTETSMMFMIPMPPTSSEIEAMPAEQQGQQAADRARRCSSSCAWSVMREVGRAAGTDAVALARGWSVISALTASIWSARGDAQADRPHARAAHEMVLRGRQGDQHLVVLAGRAGAALGLQDPDDLERQAADGDGGPDRAGAEAQVVGGGGAQDRHAQVVVVAGVGQERALPHVVGADRGVGGRGAHDRGGRVLRAGHHEGLRADLRGVRRPRRRGCRWRWRRRR